jgi:hypothetical protein
MFWRKIMPHVLTKKRMRLDRLQLLSHKKEQQHETTTTTTTTLGVDVCAWFQEDGAYFREMIKSISLNRSVYQPCIAMEMILKRHDLLVKANIHPLYVFPGARHPHQSKYHVRLQNSLDYLVRFQQQAAADEQPEQESQQLDYLQRREPMRHARTIGVSDYKLIQYLAQWMMKQHGMTCFQAPYEVAWQLVELERSGITDGTISSDALCVALGSQRLFVDATFGKYIHCLVYDGENDLVRQRSHYKHDLSSYRNYLPEVFAMTGTSPYLSSPLGRDTDYIMERRLPKYFTALQEKKERQFWQKQNIKRDYPPSFRRVVNLMRYCPVLRKKKKKTDIPAAGVGVVVAAAASEVVIAAAAKVSPDDTRSEKDTETATAPTATTTAPTTTIITDQTWELVPLHPLPVDSTVPWQDWIGFDPFGTLHPLTPDQYTPAASFQHGYTFGRPTEWDVWCRHVQPVVFKYNLDNRKNNNSKKKKKLLPPPPPVQQQQAKKAPITQPPKKVKQPKAIQQLSTW